MNDKSIEAAQADYPVAPAYCVVFKAAEATSTKVDPIRHNVDVYDLSSATAPHLLARDLCPALRALWYCLHLPASHLDYVDLDALRVKQLQNFDVSHAIYLVPSHIYSSNVADDLPSGERLVLVIAADETVDDVREITKLFDADLEVITFSGLDPSRLGHLWNRVALRLGLKSCALTEPPVFLDRVDLGPLLLPIHRLMRQLPPRQVGPVPQNEEEVQKVLYAGLYAHTVLAAIATMEKEGLGLEEARDRLETECERQAQKFTLPVTVAVPGLPSKFCQAIFDEHRAEHFFSGWKAFEPSDTFQSLAGAMTDRAAERAAIEIAATHRACATTGIGITLAPVDSKVFGKVFQLEEHCRAGAKKPRFVWRTLDEIGSALGGALTDLECALFKRAERITAFANFPFGWTVLPGDMDPIACRVPIVYRPLLPLTQTLQEELITPPLGYFRESLRVLIAEAVPEGDRIRADSYRAMTFIHETIEKRPKHYSRLVDVASPRDLAKQIEDFHPDILLLSAHGTYDAKRCLAGLVIGKQSCMGPELGRMPPFVILSACHTGPRGDGAVAVADLLLRQGAYAVLATQIPVHVRRNAMLMTRFFVYLEEAMLGRGTERTVADAWVRTASSNAVNDIVQVNDDVSAWAHKRVGGRPSPIEEFMKSRSVGRLIPGRIYKESEAILLEIIKDYGAREDVARVIRERRYVPETLFYLLMGWPDRLVLSDPVIEESRGEGASGEENVSIRL